MTEAEVTVYLAVWLLIRDKDANVAICSINGNAATVTKKETGKTIRKILKGLGWKSSGSIRKCYIGEYLNSQNKSIEINASNGTDVVTMIQNKVQTAAECKGGKNTQHMREKTACAIGQILCGDNWNAEELIVAFPDNTYGNYCRSIAKLVNKRTKKRIKIALVSDDGNITLCPII